MGYEIVFHHFNKKEEGNGYDLDKPTTFTKHLGTKFDEVSVDKLAGFVMMQLARRDLMIFDVEIYEYTKKKVSFKEAKGGVVIKNKKFILDQDTIKCMEEIPSQEVQETPPPIAPKPRQQGNAIRWEVFDADAGTVQMLAKKGYSMTLKKKYPILEEKSGVVRMNGQSIPGIDYVLMDDANQKVKLSSAYFLPEQKPLLGQELIHQAEVERQGQGQLLYQGSRGGNDMPVLR